MQDLQVRLAALGLEGAATEAGYYGDSTEAAVRAFQAHRGLRVDGVCGRQTWSSVVEAGYTLGDRLVYHRTPMLRGDDVVDLQHRLNALGFDSGRPDGIFGPNTAAALLEFQRNVGVAGDGISGPATVAALRRLSRFAGGSVASVRERESLRVAGRRLAGRRVYLATEPGLDALGENVGKGLVDLGADVLSAGGAEDDSVVASEANRYRADLFLGVRFGDIPGASCDFFASKSFRSEAGFRVARSVLEELCRALEIPPCDPSGRAYALLRETRMPAVVCQPVDGDDAGGVQRLVARSGEAGRAIVRGIRRGVEEPLDG
ncbi:MAG: peptidoglycan-binding protein [Acidimicrobiia bacterium]